jgi:hypothetical protein
MQGRASCSVFYHVYPLGLCGVHPRASVLSRAS